MNVIQTALFKLAQKEEISVKEFIVLNALSKKAQNFLELAEGTGLEMIELKEALNKFTKKHLVQEKNGLYLMKSLQALDLMIKETETQKELA